MSSILGRRACRLIACKPSRLPAGISRSRSFTTIIAPSSSFRPLPLSAKQLFQRRFESNTSMAADQGQEAVATDSGTATVSLGKSEADVGHSEAPAETTAAADGVEFAESARTGGKPRYGLGSQAQAAEGEPLTNLYVGNLFFEVTDDSLAKAFGQFGELKSCRVVTDARGLSRGFGFVEYVNHDDATRAMERMDQELLEGRRMAVQFNRPRAKGFSNAKKGPSRTLFIGNMSYDMSDKDLSNLFSDMRNVLDVRVAIDRNTGQNRGFAHADFADVESAQEAHEKLTGQTIHGRVLRIDFSAPSSTSRQA